MGLPEAEEDFELRQWDVQLLLDPGAANAAEGHVSFYVWKGLLRRVKVKDLDETTRQTLKEYAQLVSGESKGDKLGRQSFGHWSLGLDGEDEEAEVCIGRVTPIVHFTMGGVVINGHAQVLSSDLGQEQKVIPGLWAAGEITGASMGIIDWAGHRCSSAWCLGGLPGKMQPRRSCERIYSCISGLSLVATGNCARCKMYSDNQGKDAIS